MTVAYVFWHRPAGAADAGYEAALARFHAALAADPPPGYRGSAALRLDAAPWLDGQGPAYEDWYLTADWAGLGALNAHAAAGSRAPAHDEVAHAAATGAGAVYALVHGPAEPPRGPSTAWLDKPRGVPYAELHAGLARSTGQAWQRQMVLGPAPEYAVTRLQVGPAPGGRGGSHLEPRYEIRSDPIDLRAAYEPPRPPTTPRRDSS